MFMLRYLSYFAADDSFDELCFEYGIELDDVVSADPSVYVLQDALQHFLSHLMASLWMQSLGILERMHEMLFSCVQNIIHASCAF